MKSYYADESVTLYLGDCREVTEWLAADVLVTDPPYGVRWESRFGDARKGTKDQLRQADIIMSDMDTAARDDVRAAWGMKRPAIMFGSWRIARPAGVRSLLIWHKDGAFSGPLNGAFFTNHEEIYVMGDGAWRKSAPPLRSVIMTHEHRSRATRVGGHSWKCLSTDAPPEPSRTRSRAQGARSSLPATRDGRRSGLRSMSATARWPHVGCPKSYSTSRRPHDHP